MSSPVEQATRLLGWALNPKAIPARNEEYRTLLEAYDGDEKIRVVVADMTRGFDLMLLERSTQAGLVLAPAAESMFAITMSDYAKSTGGDGKSHERVLHALAHLGAATMAYPRPADLADASWVGRVSVHGVEGFLTDAVTRLRNRLTEAGEPTDPPSGTPDLEWAWHVYDRRASASATGDGRFSSKTRTGIVSRTLSFLGEQGLLTKIADGNGGEYRSTPRYRIQIRHAAAVLFTDLAALGITEITDGAGTVTTSWDARTAQTLDTASG